VQEDYWTTLRALHSIGFRSSRIYHLDCKEPVRHLDGRNGRLSSHPPLGGLAGDGTSSRLATATCPRSTRSAGSKRSVTRARSRNGECPQRDETSSED
jgi:hypothetical protein